MAQRGLDPERVARVVAALAVGERDPQQSWCAASAAVVGVSGAGVVLMSGARSLGSVCVSDPVTDVVEDVQYTLNEGPGVDDAFREKAPVLAPDLADPELERWPGFHEGALASGVRAAFGFPLLVGSVGIGALNLYHEHAGGLTREQFADAEAVAHVASRTVLGWQSGAGVRALAWQLEQVPAHRAVVHQATGMVSAQAEVPVDDALAMLRAYAFSAERAIGVVAADVVGGRLRFD